MTRNSASKPTVGRQPVEQTFGSACARWHDGMLRVSSGSIERTWQWTGHGLVTVGLHDVIAGREWAVDPTFTCDWIVPGGSENARAELADLVIETGDDDGFTSTHVRCVFEIDYPGLELAVRFTVWAYPDCPGLFARLSVKGMPGCRPAQELRNTLRADYLPVRLDGLQRRWIGYHNDTQNRNDIQLDLLKEVVSPPSLTRRDFCRWASALCLEDEGGGLALVQESHKCVNQKGHDTGLFVVDPSVGVQSDGWGILPREIRHDRWHKAWARWCIIYGPDAQARETAFKQFDRKRYPVDPARDIYTMANTWGSTTPGKAAKEAARQENIFRELDSQAGLGIDLQQIDDGWQGDQYETFSPDVDRYPDGWKPVADYARQHSVSLALWAPGEVISGDELQAAWREGGFRQYKLDFMNLAHRERIDAVEDKIRAFIRATGHSVRVNWDVTENQPRVGYYWAREYGNVYLENRKDRVPSWVVYRPETVLRDTWQLCRYLPLNKFQIPIQNVDRVDPRYSEGPDYPHAYCVAIALMATPLFFQETRHYSEAARSEIRPLLAVHKQHRDALAEGIVYPVGNKPDGAQWTGFQCVRHDAREGYLLLFRELHNTEERHTFHLHFLKHQSLTVRDLVRGTEWSATPDADGAFSVVLADAPAFLFCRYHLR